MIVPNELTIALITLILTNAGALMLMHYLNGHSITKDRIALIAIVGMAFALSRTLIARVALAVADPATSVAINQHWAVVFVTLVVPAGLTLGPTVRLAHGAWKLWRTR